METLARRYIVTHELDGRGAVMLPNSSILKGGAFLRKTTCFIESKVGMSPLSPALMVPWFHVEGRSRYQKECPLRKTYLFWSSLMPDSTVFGVRKKLQVALGMRINMV